jgi:uncharacterized protein YjbI with pentapeptide repeats
MLEGTREETGLKTGEGGPDTKEAEALAAALNHSAERVQTLWFSFLTFMIYLAIAAGTTTHLMLFLESPLNLPGLNIALPLLGFYILAPIIFVVFHFYMLLNLVLLARTAKGFEDSLARAFPEDGVARENFRMRIENTLFVQLLVGGRLEREGINAKLLSLMALITLAVAPVALLLYLQIKFLPYHSEWITWLHRGLLTVDLVLVWTLWPAYRSGWGERLRPNASSRLARAGVLSALALAYAVVVATFPDERIYRATHFLLKNSEVYWDFERPTWYGWIAPVNSLDLHRKNLVDEAKLSYRKTEGSTKEGTEQLSPAGQRTWEPISPLTGRDMTGANFVGTDLEYADFSGVILNRANVSDASAKQARFSSAQLQGASFIGAHLEGAAFDDAHLEGASLNLAQLQGASFIKAHLQGTALFGTQLQGASFISAHLEGAVFDGAHLDGASLSYARLLGASFAGASLDGADLRGAWLLRASLQSASLQSAWLSGASLDDAQLQGAWLTNVFVWRADARTAIWEDSLIAGSNTRPHEDWNWGDRPHEDWNWEDQEWQDLLIARLFKGDWVVWCWGSGDWWCPMDWQARVAKRLKQRLDPKKDLEGEEEMAKVWADHERSSAAPEVVKKNLAKQWRETACAGDGAPYVARALLRRLESTRTSSFAKPLFDSPEVPKLAAAFLDTEHCPGARGLSGAEIAKLESICRRANPADPKCQASAPPPAPKQ